MDRNSNLEHLQDMGMPKKQIGGKILSTVNDHTQLPANDPMFDNSRLMTTPRRGLQILSKTPVMSKAFGLMKNLNRLNMVGAALDVAKIAGDNRTPEEVKKDNFLFDLNFPTVRTNKQKMEGMIPTELQEGGVVADSNELALKGMMKEKMAARAFLLNKQNPGTLGGLMSKKISTVSPDRKLPQMSNPNVGKIREFAESLSRPEMGALLNTTASPFGKQGWIKNVVLNPEVDITFDKVKKAAGAMKGAHELKDQGYKF